MSTGRRSLRSLAGGLLLAAASVAGSVGNLEKTLSGGGLRIEAVTSSEFRDLDDDGVKEILARGRGALRGAVPGGTLLLDLDASRTDGNGYRMLRAAPEEVQALAGVFRFQRRSFQWAPILLAFYTPGLTEVGRFGIQSFGSTDLVHLSYRVGGEVTDLLLGCDGAEVEPLLRVVRGDRPGEGVWLRGRKVLAVRGLPDPFRRGSRHPGLLAQVRYRWDGADFVPEHWTLKGYGFRGDLDYPSIPRWPEARGLDERAARWAWGVQRAAERGAGEERFDLSEFCRSRHGARGCEVVFEHDGMGVVVHRVIGEPEAHYYVQPFREAVAGGRAAWVGLDEVPASEAGETP